MQYCTTGNLHRNRRHASSFTVPPLHREYPHIPEATQPPSGKPVLEDKRGRRPPHRSMSKLELSPVHWLPVDAFRFRRVYNFADDIVINRRHRLASEPDALSDRGSRKPHSTLHKTHMSWKEYSDRTSRVEIAARRGGAILGAESKLFDQQH